MRCPEWNESVLEGTPEARKRLQERMTAVLMQIIDEDCGKAPTLDMVRRWHRALFSGLVPLEYYAGNFRDDDSSQPCLQIYEVTVGGIPGTPCLDVVPTVGRFINGLRLWVRELDQEWVRIHPFANGNGRTGQLWANYVFCRYGFGPVVRVRPRPDQPYGIAAKQSMLTGDHRMMEALLLDLLLQSYGT